MSCSNKNEVLIGFDKKVLLAKSERQVPITSTFYISYSELSKCLLPKTALSKVISAPEYRVYVGVVTNDEMVEKQYLNISSECFSLINESSYKGRIKYHTHKKSFYYMHYMAEDKYPLCIIIESKDSSLISKYYNENEFISRIN